MDNWEAKVVFRPGVINAAMYLSRSRGYGVREYLTEGGKTVVTVSQDKPLEGDPVFLELEDEQLRAIQNAITEHGVKPAEASYTQGKLEAVTEHLADMRAIVFKEDQ